MDPTILLVVLCVCSSGLWAAETLDQSETLRLVGETSRCAGEVELKHKGEWRPVVAWRPWTQMSSASVCKQLDCGSDVSSTSTRHPSDRPVWGINPACVQSTSSLSDCVVVYYSLKSSRGFSVICSDSVRLMGPARCSGRLEVSTNQSWSSVCEGALDQQDAEVVCRELGCGPPSVLQGALYGEAQAPLWSREFRCEGNESGLLDCGRSDSDTNTCSPDKAVGLTCSETLRLVGETRRCAGEVELKLKGEWRPVEDWGEWTQMSSASVCKQLDCGSAVSSTSTRHHSDRPVWWIYSACVQSTSSLSDCVGVDDVVQSSRGVSVICSGSLPNVSVSSSFDWLFDDWGPVVFWGFSFNISCSVDPQYPGGWFQLLLSASDTAQNFTLPAVDHSARFLFPTAAYGHQGNYTCVYHTHVFSHDFSSESQPLYVTVSGFIKDQIIRHVFILITFPLCIACIYLYSQYRARRMKEEEKEKEEAASGRRRRRRRIPDVDVDVVVSSV